MLDIAQYGPVRKACLGTGILYRIGARTRYRTRLRVPFADSNLIVHAAKVDGRASRFLANLDFGSRIASRIQQRNDRQETELKPP